MGSDSVGWWPPEPDRSSTPGRGEVRRFVNWRTVSSTRQTLAGERRTVRLTLRAKPSWTWVPTAGMQWLEGLAGMRALAGTRGKDVAARMPAEDGTDSRAIRAWMRGNGREAVRPADVPAVSGSSRACLPRLATIVLCCLSFAPAGAFAAPGAAAAAAADAFHFTNGHLVTMTSDTARVAELVVRAGRITYIGKNPPDLAGVRTIDLQGGYLIPGLAEMHAHVPGASQPRQYRDDVLTLWVLHGITTVRGMLGEAGHLTLKRRLLDQDVLGPRLVTSGPSVNGRSAPTPERARQMVDAQAEAGYDFVKIHPGLTRAAYDAMADAAARAGLRFAGHVPEAVGLRHAFARRQHTIDHLDGYIQALIPDFDPAETDAGSFGAAVAGRADPALIDRIVEQTRAADAWVVPTETLFVNLNTPLEELDARPELAYLPRNLLARYRRSVGDQPGGADRSGDAFLDIRRRLLAALHRGGVGVLLGSDSPQIFNVPGPSIHRELQLMVDAGLTPFEALVLGTVNPARFLGRDGEQGVLQVGAAADLVWVAGNPLVDIGNASRIRGIMVRGRWIDEELRARSLGDIARRYAAR